MCALALPQLPSLNTLPRPLHVAVLDDELFDRTRIRRCLSRAGHALRVSEATRLDEFQAVLDADRIDIVLVDYRLPRGDGFDALDLLRAHPRNGGCPAIMVSRLADTGLARLALKCGFSGFLAKDELSPARLDAAVRECRPSMTSYAHQPDSPDRARLKLCPAPNPDARPL